VIHQTGHAEELFRVLGAHLEGEPVGRLHHAVGGREVHLEILDGQEGTTGRGQV